MFKEPLSTGNVEELLSDLPYYSPSSETEKLIFRALENFDRQKEWNPLKRSKFYFFIPYLMNLKKVTATVVGLALLVGGTFYYRQNSYAYHLNKASHALEKLQTLLHGERRVSFFIPSAYAETLVDSFDENEVAEFSLNEDEIANLVAIVVSETEVAIDIAEDINQPEEVVEAFNEIADVQEETVDVVSDAVGAVDDEGVLNALNDVLDVTIDAQEQVNEVVEQAEEAVANGDETIEVEVATTEEGVDEDNNEENSDKGDDEKQNDAQAQLDATKAVFEKLKADGASEEEMALLLAKISRAEAALNEGKWGRVKGLTTAVNAKARSIERKNPEKKDEEMIEAPKEGAAEVSEEQEAVNEEAEVNAETNDTEEDAVVTKDPTSESQKENPSNGKSQEDGKQSEAANKDVSGDVKPEKDSEKSASSKANPLDTVAKEKVKN